MNVRSDINYAASSQVRHTERGDMEDLFIYRKLLGGLKLYCLCNVYYNNFILHLLERVFGAVNNVCYYNSKNYGFVNH